MELVGRPGSRVAGGRHSPSWRCNQVTSPQTTGEKWSENSGNVGTLLPVALTPCFIDWETEAQRGEGTLAVAQPGQKPKFCGLCSFHHPLLPLTKPHKWAGYRNSDCISQCPRLPPLVGINQNELSQRRFCPPVHFQLLEVEVK